MKYRLIVYGLLVVAMAIAWSTFASLSINSERDTTEILIVANPVNPLNPVVKNPYQEEYEQMLYPTVRITAGFSTGSGVIFSTTDAHRYTQIYILTASHVVENEVIVNIELYDAKVITGTVVITDTVKDLALIKPQINTDYADKIYTGKLADKNYIPYLFSPVWVVGCALGLKPRPSFGHLSALCDSVANWEITAPVLPGNSGGPVYAERSGVPSDDGNAYEYEVIGIAVWVKVYDGQLVTTMAGIVPITEIYDFLESYKRLQ